MKLPWIRRVNALNYLLVSRVFKPSLLYSQYLVYFLVPKSHWGSISLVKIYNGIQGKCAKQEQSIRRSREVRPPPRRERAVKEHVGSLGQLGVLAGGWEGGNQRREIGWS